MSKNAAVWLTVMANYIFYETVLILVTRIFGEIDDIVYVILGFVFIVVMLISVGFVLKLCKKKKTDEN